MGCSDEELMQDLQRGEMQAFDALYERHSRPLFNFIRRLLRDESLAEDVFQETCMRVLRNAARFDPRARFRTWLYTVAHNLCMDELRRRRRRMSIPAGELPGPQPVPDPHERLESESAHRLLWGLRPELRAVVVLRVLHGYSQEETARIVGAPVGTVKSRLHHALKQLRRMAGEHES